MFLETAIKAHLATYAELTALVGTRIHPGSLPQNSPLPALVYSKVSGVPEYAHDGANGAVESRIQISCLGADYGTTKNVSKAVKRAFRPFEIAPGTMGGVGGVHVAGVFLENEMDIFESSDVEHLERYHIPQDWMFSHQEDF